MQGASSLLLFVLLAHALPAGALAPASLAQGILVLSQALGDFGLSQAAVTALPARTAAAREREGDLLAGAARTFAIAAAAALGIALAAAAVVPASTRLAVACIAPAAAASVLVAGADGLLRATGDFRRPVLLVAAARLGAFAGLPAALFSGSAAVTCAAISAGTLVGSLPAVAVLAARLRHGSTDSGGDFARAALPLGLGLVFVVAGGRLNTVLLGVFSSVTAAAVFEAAWRLYQLCQYAVGSAATAVGPFAADALGAGRYADLGRLVQRTLAGVVAGGCAFAAAILVLRDALGEALFDELGRSAGHAAVPLALVAPLSLAGLVAVYMLSAAEEHRRRIPEAYAAGTLVNLALLPLLVRGEAARGAAEACAAGLVVTSVWLLVRLRQLMRELGTERAPDAAPVGRRPAR